MELKGDTIATDIICLKRPTALDKIADAIPKPKGAVPDFGLPKWKVMPLEAKIPLVPGPEAAYNFTRQKIGKGLWVSTRDAEFNLSDPYCHEMKFDYDPLHDKHLLPFFSRPQTIQHLINIHQITNSLDAKCSLKDYNMYRKYLRRLHCDSVKKEMNNMWEIGAERRAIQFAENQAKKEYENLRKREKLMHARRGIIERQKQLEKLKVQQQKEKQVKLQQRLILLAQLKREDQQRRSAKGKARAQAIADKKTAAANIERQKIIKTLLEWRKKELIRTKALELRLAFEREEKHKNIEKKWKMRQVFQEKEIEKERFMLDCINQRRQEFMNSYNEMLLHEDKRMQRLHEKVKIYLRCYKARRAAGKEIVCCPEAGNKEEKIKDLTCKPQPYPSAKKAQMSKVKGKFKRIYGKYSKTKKSKRKSSKAKAKKDSVIELTKAKKSHSLILDLIEEKSQTSTVASEPVLSTFDKCRCEAIKLNKLPKVKEVIKQEVKHH